MTIQTGKEMWINGKQIDIPDYIEENGRIGCSSIVNGKVFINGYELLSDGSWKKTLRALWHKYF